MRVGLQLTGQRPPQRLVSRHQMAGSGRSHPDEGRSPVLAAPIHESVDPEFDVVDLADVLRGLAVSGEAAEHDDPC